MRMTRSMLLGTAALLACAATPVRAANTAPTADAAPSVTQAQASTVETQLRGWLASLVGPALALGPRPVQLTPAGDHFDVVVPIRGAGGDGPLDLTATARPLDGGRWSIQDVHVPSPMQFSMEVPVPPAKDAPKGAPKTEKAHFTARFDQSTGTMQLDPSFATPSTWTTSAKGATVHGEGPGLVQDTSIGASNSTMTVTPAGADRVDVNGQGSIEDYRIQMHDMTSPPIEAAFHMIRARASLTGLSRSRATTITQGLAGVVAAVMAAPPAAGMPMPMPMPKVAPELASTMLTALRDLAAGMEMEESFDGIAVKYGTVEGGLKAFRLGFGARSDQGMVNARLDLGLQGPVLPDLHLGGMETVIPQRIEIRPTVSGVAVNDLMTLLTAASQNRDPSPADVAALFSHGGITVGVESMAVEVGGATFNGQGRMQVANPQDITGTAQISARNFDDLVQTVQAVPQFAQALPVLVFAKGIGRTVQDKLVWDVSYEGGRVLVNKVDLSAMAGGGPPGPKHAP